jgi:hypothetical protein
MANIGHQQVRCGHHVEPALVTAGDDLTEVARFLPAGSTSYGVADVLNALLPNIPPILSRMSEDGGSEEGLLTAATAPACAPVMR